MDVETLTESPLSPSSELGPYRSADYFALPDQPRCELLFGRLYVMPAPSVLHQIVAARLWRHLDEIARRTGGTAAIAPLDVVLADHTVVQPDVVYWTQRITREEAQRPITRIPDLVVEVLSPSDIRRDRNEKLRLYAASGIREFWIVDPLEKQHDFLLNRGGRFEVVLPLDGFSRSEVLPGVELNLLGFWQQVDSCFKS